MRVWNRRGYFFDVITELLGIKTGLVISEEALVRALESSYAAHSDGALILGGPTHWWDGDKDDTVSIRAEEMEFALLVTMHHFGAIKDLRDGADIIIDFVREHAEDFGIRQDDKMAVYQVTMPIQMELADLTAPSLLPAVKDQSAVDELQRAFSLRNIMDQSYPVDREWDGQIPLEDLFKSEAIPVNATPDSYFDQRYIDFLLAQPGSLTSINWRQFEYLTAEYFGRNGYQITVGQGRSDGGVDIWAEKQADLPGPELVVVQCRRYGDNQPVGVDKVRSFWATVDDTGATRGLIATTSRLTSGARSYCDARKYRLTAAEGDVVRGWLRGMAKT